MPVLRIIGFEARNVICLELIKLLKQSVASIVELQITSEQVTPFVFTDGVLQERRSECVVVYVDGLFEKPERTPEVCQRLTSVIYLAVRDIVLRYGLTDVKFIEVINNKINPKVDGYTSGNPHEDSW